MSKFPPRKCKKCGKEFFPAKWSQTNCSRYCGRETTYQYVTQKERKK